jgi:phosphoribosylaminoimidazole-succinocarboxamide synthase
LSRRAKMVELADIRLKDVVADGHNLCAIISKPLIGIKTPPAPKLPREVIDKTSAKYREAFRRLTNKQVETR